MGGKFETAKLFDSPPTQRVRCHFERAGFVIPQLSESAAIEYAKSCAQSRPLELDIYDAEGNLVRKIVMPTLAKDDRK